MTGVALLLGALTSSTPLAGWILQLQAVELGRVLIVADISSGHRIHIQTHAAKHTRIRGASPESSAAAGGAGATRGQSWRTRKK